MSENKFRANIFRSELGGLKLLFACIMIPPKNRLIYTIPSFKMSILSYNLDIEFALGAGGTE